MSKYFSKKEMECPCCKKDVQPRLYSFLDDVRQECGFPIYVNSGFRCESYNKRVDGSDKSQHKLGLAADLRCKNDSIKGHILTALLHNGAKFIGVYPSFIHVDLRNWDVKHQIIRFYK